VSFAIALEGLLRDYSVLVILDLSHDIVARVHVEERERQEVDAEEDE